jgi:hypothetical protein
MSDFSFTNLAASAQEVWGSGQLTNGQSIIRTAAADRVLNSTVKVSFTSQERQASLESRVYLKIPNQYWPVGSITQVLDSNPTGSNPGAWAGIYFPVTPTVKQDTKVNWNPANIQHSNYAVYSYQNTDVGTISVSGQFPVQNRQEAVYWLATVHALRAITKMRTGNDTLAGSPPPVCRFNAYGANVYENIPVVVGGFSIDLPSDVDYITGFNFGNRVNKVPTLSTISMTLIPVYSRREMSNFSVDQFISGALDGRGYL